MASSKSEQNSTTGQSQGAPRKLRAGLVGLGMMGRHHARVLGSLDGVELVGVCDPMGDPH